MEVYVRKTISSIILIGSIWGIIEATIGHVLHMFTLGIGWLLWYPIAFFILDTVYRMTRKTYSILFTAMIASTIKMIDIFFTPRYDYVINPAVSIILEALTLYVIYNHILVKEKDVELDFFKIMSACIGWKFLYLSYLFFMPQSWLDISCLSGLIPFAKFFFQETILNSILIWIGACSVKKISFITLYDNISSITDKHRILVPTTSLITLLIAIIIQIKL